jgi:hypothetical protein
MKTSKCRKHGIYNEHEAYVEFSNKYKDNKVLRCRKCIDERKITNMQLNTATNCHIHGQLNETNAYVSIEGGRQRKRFRCKICHHKRRIKQYADNREQAIIDAAKWKRANRDRVRQLEKENKKKNPEKYKKWEKDFRDRHRERINKEAVCRNVGLAVVDYEKMLIAQENKCAICRCEETRVQKEKLMRLCIDHDHETGRIRGLLCHNCNSGLGKFGDSPDLLTLAAIYLMD